MALGGEGSPLTRCYVRCPNCCDDIELGRNIGDADNFRVIAGASQYFPAAELNVPEKDVKELLVTLILDNRISGHIDQVNRLLEHGDRSKGMKKYTAMDKWNTQLRSLYQTVGRGILHCFLGP